MYCIKRPLCVAVLILLGTISMLAQSNNGWRGLDRDGVYKEKGLLKAWPTEGPVLLWSVTDAGKGLSSPVIASGRLYITGLDEEEKREVLSAYTLDGKQLYQVAYGNPWLQSFPDARTTPAVVGDKLYVISGMGEIVCLNAADGKVLWTVDGGKQFGVTMNMWGVSESPLVVDNKVIFTSVGEQAAMVALNASTGAVAWQSPLLKDTCAQVSPLLISHNGIKQIVGCSREYLFGVNPSTGEMEWKFNDWDFTTDWGGLVGICVNTPIYKDGKLFVSNGYGMRSHLLQLNKDATGVSVVWRNDDLGAHTGGMVVVNDVIYAANFIDNNKGDWMAVDWETGKTCYKTTWQGHSKGSIIAADNMLYCYEERRGVVALVNPTPEKFDIVSQFRVNQGMGGHWAHPVIDNGIFYIRHGKALLAYQIRQ